MAETLNLVKLGQGTKAGLLRVISYEFWQPRLAKAHIELGLRQAVELKANFDMHAAKYQPGAYGGYSCRANGQTVPGRLGSSKRARRLQEEICRCSGTSILQAPASVFPN